VGDETTMMPASSCGEGGEGVETSSNGCRPRDSEVESYLCRLGRQRYKVKRAVLVVGPTTSWV